MAIKYQKNPKYAAWVSVPIKFKHLKAHFWHNNEEFDEVM